MHFYRTIDRLIFERINDEIKKNPRETAQ